MGLAISNLKPIKLSNRKGAVADITFDSSYPTGGEDLLSSQLGLNVVDFFSAEDIGGYTFAYDRTNKKLIAYKAGVQVEDKTNLSTLSVKVFAIGW